MFDINKVFELHDAIIKRYGGATGLRDQAMLEAALARPFQTFGGHELYPDAFSKAAAILESILFNHPFVDGNKRTGYLLCLTLLREAGVKLTANEDDRYNFVIDVTVKKLDFDQITNWLRLNSTHIEP
jgi:death on curing protein